MKRRSPLLPFLSSKNKGNKTAADQQICLHWHTDSIAVALVNRSADKPTVKCASIEPSSAALTALISDWDVAGTNTIVLLNPAQYHFSLIEAPKVPTDELVNALRWQLPAIDGLNPEDLVIDYIELPADAYRNRQTMMYVAAMPKGEMEEMAQTVKHAGLTMAAIEVPEISIGRLAELTDSNQQAIAWIHQSEGLSAINVYADNSLYFTRQLTVNAKNAQLQDVLEIKRSLDYCRHQVGCAANNKVWFSPLMSGEVGLLRMLEQELGLQVSNFDLAEWVSSEQSLSPDFQQQYLLAIAAALREHS